MAQRQEGKANEPSRVERRASACSNGKQMAGGRGNWVMEALDRLTPTPTHPHAITPTQ